MPTSSSRARAASLLLAAWCAPGVLGGCSSPPPAPAAGPAPTGLHTPSPARPGTGTPAADGTPATGGSPPPPAQASPGAAPPDITLAFAGDIHFARQLAPLLDDPESVWADRLPQLAAADLAMANLETAIATDGTPEHKTYTFRTSPTALTVLSQAGIDVLSMANNHAADYGSRGVGETLAALKTSPVPVVGFGADARAAFAPASFDVKGVRVAVLAASQLTEETTQHFSAGEHTPGIATTVDESRLRAATRAAAADHDVVVVYMHWGTEGTTCPNEQQRALARHLSDDGADVVVGTHAHRPQGSGMLGRTFVGYGLGNYVWYNASPGSRSSGVLTLTVDGGAVAAARALPADRRHTGAPLVTARTWTPRIVSGSGLPRDPGELAGETAQAADVEGGARGQAPTHSTALTCDAPGVQAKPAESRVPERTARSTSPRLAAVTECHVPGSVASVPGSTRVMRML